MVTFSKQRRGLKGLEMNSAAGASSAEVLIYGEIGFDFTARDFIEQLASLGNVTQLNVRINSPGGIGSEGIAIYQALVRHPAQKTIYIDAAAYSAASIIAMAASPGQLRMAFNARLMMHNGWSIVMGDKNDLRGQADSLELLDGTIAATYQKRMQKTSKEEILALMDKETWYDADGALEVGLIDEIFEGDEELPGIDDQANLARRFKNLPANLTKQPAAQLTAAAAEEAARVDVMTRWAQINERAA